MRQSKAKVEPHLDPAIVEAGKQAAKALSDVDAGWARVIKEIANKGGLTKDASGAWGAPKEEAA